MWGELHEEKRVQIHLTHKIEPGKANRLFRELGATLHYDTYNFPALEHENWQSDSLLDVELSNNGVVTDAQEFFDGISLLYPLALRPASDQWVALQLTGRVIRKFRGTATYQGNAYKAASIQNDWNTCTNYLLTEWAEVPGSRSLAIMIEENYN